MNSQFQRTIWLIVRASLSLLLLAALPGVSPAQQASSQTPAATSPIIFTPHDSEISCPKDVHAKGGCLLVTGKNNDKHAFWTKFRRNAYLGMAVTEAPAGCMGVSTAGSLMSDQGELHFQGTGYYCPKTDAAVYHGSFDEAEAQKFGMPANFTINYDGRKLSETFKLGN